jgi:hypothetical protein
MRTWKAIVFLLGVVAPLSAARASWDVYGVAHPDDWQLFFSPNLPIDVQNGDQVLIIQFTAGDAGREDGYWQAREAGAKASVRWLVGEKPEADTVVSINNHLLHLWTSGPITIAFLRLPDGGGLGAEQCSDVGVGYGTPAYHCESLIQLLSKPIPKPITAVDGSTTYLNNNDLSQTIGELLLRVTGPDTTTTWVNTFSPSSELNPNDHPDHATVWSLIPIFEPNGFSFDQIYNAAYFAGYSLWNQPATLTQAQHDQKMGLFSAYYFTVIDQYGSGPTELCAAPDNEMNVAASFWRQNVVTVTPHFP